MTDFISQKHPATGIRLGAGALTGIIAGLVMAIPMMLYHLAIPEHGVFYPVNMIATWAGVAFIPTGFGSHTMVGLLVHLVFSAILGVIWGSVFTNTPDRVTSTISGMIYGIMIYWVVSYFAAPIFNPVFTQTVGFPMLVAHLIFGASFALYPVLVDRFCQLRRH